MSLKHILMAAVVAAALPSAALANDYYRCNDRLCHDDQADETRRLNEMQLENPGAGLGAVPGYRDDQDGSYDRDGQGGPYYESPDDVDPPDDMDRGGQPPQDDAYPNDDHDGTYGPPPDDDDQADEPDDQGDDQYPDDDRY